MQKLNFSQILKTKRQEKKITLSSLAKSLKLTDGIIGHYEKGIRYPSKGVLKRICELLDLPYKKTYLLIQSEKASAETKEFFNPDRPTDPELRNVLLDCYKENFELDDKSFSPVSKQDVKKELERFPLHPIEVILLKEIIRKTLPLEEGQMYHDKPMDYFSRLSWKGKGHIVLLADLKWSIDLKRHLIVIKLVDDKEPILRLYDYHEIFPKMPLLRKLLINAYSEEYGEDYSKITGMIGELGTSPFHFFERKVIQEVYNELNKIGLIKSTIDPLTLKEEELVKTIKEVKFDWAYNQKRGFLLITFEKKKGELITKKFGHSWRPL